MHPKAGYDAWPSRAVAATAQSASTCFSQRRSWGYGSNRAVDMDIRLQEWSSIFGKPGHEHEATHQSPYKVFGMHVTPHTQRTKRRRNRTCSRLETTRAFAAVLRRTSRRWTSQPISDLLSLGLSRDSVCFAARLRISGVCSSSFACKRFCCIGFMALASCR